MCLSMNGKLLYCPGKDNVIIIYDLQKRRQIGTLEGHSDQINSLCSSLDGHFLYSAGKDQIIIIWDLIKHQ